ncbi:MAG TPA: methyltransferase domain-containing protein [Cytophagaceae bacterium]|jgi:ubiquinone/menaquinone biosynthesis C-methylase UbiE/uncharacterized protein YbaR (Trm112 family)|nr:methyltransferase domain-containing protein [Cytophagaceae bacterium]
MDIFKQLKKIKELYSIGTNIIDYVKNLKQEKNNSSEAIMISYDFQAGSYIQLAKEKSEYLNNYTKAISETINELGIFNSIVEIGVGEATVLANLIPKIKNKPDSILGFDISWSRIRFARHYLSENKINNAIVFVGDLFNIPLQDNSIDIVYTSHSIEPNGGREKEALTELYRISNKYIILLEPCFEMASEEAQARMTRLGYVKNLYNTAKELGYKVKEHRLFEYSSNPLNPTGLTIIEKETVESSPANPLACPITKAPLKEVKGSMYCEESLLAYPIIDKIPCLLSSNAVIASHFMDNFSDN